MDNYERNVLIATASSAGFLFFLLFLRLYVIPRMAGKWGEWVHQMNQEKENRSYQLDPAAVKI
jgi:hypothetical protein